MHNCFYSLVIKAASWCIY